MPLDCGCTVDILYFPAGPSKGQPRAVIINCTSHTKRRCPRRDIRDAVSRKLERRRQAAAMGRIR